MISTVSTSGSDIITCFNSATVEFLATWADSSNPDLIFNPTYSFFINLIPPPSNLPLPPSSFKGTIVRNHFLTQTEISHKLVLTPPTNPTSIVSYEISRNGVVIKLLSAPGPLVYYDHNRSNKKKDLYEIVSLNAEGKRSKPLSITL